MRARLPELDRKSESLRARDRLVHHRSPLVDADDTAPKPDAVRDEAVDVAGASEWHHAVVVHWTVDLEGARSGQAAAHIRPLRFTPSFPPSP